jgi:hypothetical protein
VLEPEAAQAIVPAIKLQHTLAIISQYFTRTLPLLIVGDRSRSKHGFAPQSLVKLPTHKAISLSVFLRTVAATTPRLAFRHSGLNDPCCGPSGAEAAPTRTISGRP